MVISRVFTCYTLPADMPFPPFITIHFSGPGTALGQECVGGQAVSTHKMITVLDISHGFLP